MKIAKLMYITAGKWWNVENSDDRKSYLQQPSLVPYQRKLYQVIRISSSYHTKFLKNARKKFESKNDCVLTSLSSESSINKDFSQI